MPRNSGSRILIVAGHDSSGGAGIDADREAVADLPVEALCVVTAFTDQDDRTVRSLGARRPEEWLREASRAARAGVDAVKFGLLPGAEHIPMRQIPDQLGALPRDRHLLVLCHHGVRSRYVTRFLRAQGITAVSNIAGGIEAWAEKLDPAMRRY